jgi:hypothetical protein
MPGLLESTIASVVPVTKTLGSGSLARLPTTQECAIHLGFLECVVALKQDVEQWNMETGWNSYLQLAVPRFQVWIAHFLNDKASSSEIPPLDVLVVWHAFMLNPGPYSKFERAVSQISVHGKGIDWQKLVYHLCCIKKKH